MPERTNQIVLSIGGFDPCGGAGVLADIQTLQQCQVQGMAVVTALTAQNEDEVLGLEWQDFETIKFQLPPLFNRYRFDIIKIGIIENIESLLKVIDLILDHNPNAKIIWDPILKSSSGFDLFENPEQIKLNDLIKKLYLITPNKMEFGSLTSILNSQIINTNLLLKGGHNEGNDTSDLLVYKEGTETKIKGNRMVNQDKHGTGCVLSSAIAAALSKGNELEEACRFGKRYTEAYLMSGKDKLGKHYQIKI